MCNAEHEDYSSLRAMLSAGGKNAKPATEWIALPICYSSDAVASQGAATDNGANR
jgi:hypothetical protein